MPAQIHELRTRRATLAAEANKALRAAAHAAAEAGRSLTAEETAAQDAYDVQLAQLDAEIATEEKILDRVRQHGTAPAVEPVAAAPGTVAGRIEDVALRADRDSRRGFDSHYDFLLACIENSGHRDRGNVADERLQALAVLDKEDRSGAGELAFMLPRAFTPAGLHAAAGSDEQGGYQDRYGGFAVPTTLLPGLLQVGNEPDPTAGRTGSIPMASPVVEMLARTDKNHTTSVGGGFTVTRKPETVAASSTRAEIEKVTLKASSLFGLAYATEEILVDSAISFVAVIAAGFQSQFAFHMVHEKFRGLGGNEYLGMEKSSALVSVAKESGQTADTIVIENIINMRARCWGYSEAIWIANHDTFPQLVKLALVVEGANGGGLVLAYAPSLVPDRPDMLFGRPIFYSEHAQKLGDAHDITLGNWSQYLEGLYQPLQSAESVHVRFVNHERTFKFWLRNAGAPWWRSALTPHKGALTLSPFVGLAERA